MEHRVIQAICDTLLQSLWLGLVISVVTGLTVVFTRKSSARLRYRLLTGYLLMFTVGTGLTLLFHLASPDGIEELHNQAISSSENNIFFAGYQYLNSRSEIIVLIWFLMICIKFTRLGVGFYNLYRMKREQLTPIGKYWKDKVSYLCEVLEIKNKITVVESGIAKIPMVVGHLKPMILLPVGLLTNLSVAEVEVILLHELSHIRRRDYLVNLLQNFLELIFFFNPAVLWISTLIKAERENCCDDMVIATKQNKTVYINALLSCQQYQVDQRFAMMLSANRTSLVARVRRMVLNDNHTLSGIEKSLLTVCLVTAVVLTATFSSVGSQSVSKTPGHIVTLVAKQLIEPRQTDTLNLRKKHSTKPVKKRIKLKRNNGPKAVLVAPQESLQLSTADAVQSRSFPEESRARSKESRKNSEVDKIKSEEARIRSEEAKIRADESKIRLDQAKIRIDAAKARAEEAKIRADDVASKLRIKIESNGPTGPIGPIGPTGEPGPTGNPPR
nr:M56 family metallopeptidase [Pedobacter panaciterrae]